MSIATNIHTSPHVGIRDLKIHLSSFLKKGSLIVTDRGTSAKISQSKKNKFDSTLL